MNTTPKANGPELSPRQMQALEFTFADHLRVIGERDAAQQDVGKLRQAVTEALTQIETLRSWNAHLESQVESAIAKRDQAVAERAVYETFFAGIQAQMREFKVPAVPLIRQKPPENGPNLP